MDGGRRLGGREDCDRHKGGSATGATTVHVGERAGLMSHMA